MKYETPELKASTPAINAIQGDGDKSQQNVQETSSTKELAIAYQDWE
jgi:hypothetical protein